MKRKCRICGRYAGSTKDRCGEEDGVPLGPIEQCPTCKRWACPDCMHEADCCFVEEDEHGPDWCPPGWRPINDETVPGGKSYERIPVRSPR